MKLTRSVAAVAALLALGGTAYAEMPTDVEMVATEDVREFVTARGGRVFVWTSMHYALFAPICLLETSLDPPKGDLGFRRIAGPGFDIYLESTQHVWPKMRPTSSSLKNGRPWTTAACRGRPNDDVNADQAGTLTRLVEP